MTSEIRSILELPNNISGQQQSQLANFGKLKTGTYKKLPQYPFFKNKQKIQQYKSFFTDQIIPEYLPPFTNLVQSEHYQQQEAIYAIIGPVKPINISEMQYNAHFNENDYYCSYGQFMDIIETIFKYQFNFTVAADRLNMSVYNLFIQFYNYCSIIQSDMNSSPAPKKNQHDYMRCMQAINHFLNVSSDFEKLTSLIDKNAEEQEQQQSALLNACFADNNLQLLPDQILNFRQEIGLNMQNDNTVTKNKSDETFQNVYQQLLSSQAHKIPIFNKEAQLYTPKKQKQQKAKQQIQNPFYTVDVYQYFPYSIQPFEDEQAYVFQDQRKDIISFVSNHIGNKPQNTEIDLQSSQFDDFSNYSTLQAKIPTQ